VTSELQEQPVVLTIAGFDPSGGAGTIADIRTIQQFQCVAVAAITSITFQNEKTYTGAVYQDAESVRAQLTGIVAQKKVAAVKIGMLPTAEIVREVALLIHDFNLPAPVVDPVMQSTSGGKLMQDDAFAPFVTELVPRARVITPNIPEAEKLAGVNIRDHDSMRQAAARIRELGARAVLIKGGHLKQETGARRQEAGERARESVDLLNDAGNVTVFRGDWIDAPNVRGTGCMLASAIACGLARGDELEQAINTARQFVMQLIQKSEVETRNSKPNLIRS
jgi:hydroxymethylpyrimidine kinase/phosphomethylpyrimidine kinase